MARLNIDAGLLAERGAVLAFQEQLSKVIAAVAPIGSKRLEILSEVQLAQL